MNIWQLLSSFPTSIPSVLMGVLLVYWLLSIFGLVDFGHHLDAGGGHDLHLGHHDIAHHDVHADGDSADLHTMAGYLVAMGLGGVPFSIVATLLIFFTWLFTALVHQYLLVQVPTAMLQLLLGSGTLLAAIALSIPISANLIKPMRNLFVRHYARDNHSLIGHSCRIVTESVNEHFGRAEIEDHGVALNIRVWASSPNTLKKNSAAVVLAYNDSNHQYEVSALTEQI
ncbi:ubiquinone biosynthesis protein [Undibacterium sp. JH2W]|uniref:ubiquinone biosynthesis protein n=1 Tax=Undibacterium sp. JH2W TaxID=3413037 RepID=UPI003BF44DD0